ncbi:MAG TPA: succinyl-CoA--3-ketoacid-CoA transferase, partial [Clostridia bacterium]|nr:succinyl-CoA--3-ketoacid-CoA transferase [Clostridia bacterium]
LPVTAKNRVNLIITELAVIEVTPEGFLLREIHPDTTVEEVRRLTGANLNVSEDLKTMEV